MTLYTLPNATTPDSILVQIVAAEPAFTPLLLLFTFMVIFLGGIGRQKARLGTADYSMWAVIASISMLMLSLVLSLATGMIQLDWLVIVVVVTIFSGVWFFMSQKQSEV